MGLGHLLSCATISGPKIDSLVTSSQRSSLGMCKRCGNLRLIACSRCKGRGIIKEGGLFSFNAMDDLSRSFEGNSKKISLSCKNCQARGHFICPECSKIPQG